MTAFFDEWVFSPGFVHYSIDSVRTVAVAGGFESTIFIRQKQRGTNITFTSTPLTVSLIDDQWNLQEERKSIAGAYDSVKVFSPFMPSSAFLNRDGRMNIAVIDEEKTIKTTGTQFFDLPHFTITVNSVSDSAMVRVEHHWAAPDPVSPSLADIRISTTHYWRVDGIFSQGFSATGKVYYDARNITTGGGGNFDNDILGTLEDSVVLLYRKGAGYEWQVHPAYTLNMLGSATNKFGFITFQNLQTGEYAIGYGRVNTSVVKEEAIPAISVFPNPSSGVITVAVGEDVLAVIYDSAGRIVKSLDLKKGASQILLENEAKGVYVISVTSKDGSTATRKLQIQ